MSKSNQTEFIEKKMFLFWKRIVTVKNQIGT